MPRDALIQFRAGTAAAWASVNPILAAGEPSFELDTGVQKIGDGVTAYASLAASGGGGAVASVDGLAGAVALTGRYGPVVGSDNWLKAWGSSIDTLIRSTTITRDSNQAATGANVIWPDGTAGVYAGTASTGTLGAIDSYTVTYVGATTKTVTQPTMTRNAGGAVTNRPAMTVS